VEALPLLVCKLFCRKVQRFRKDLNRLGKDLDHVTFLRNEDRGLKMTIVCHSWMIVEDRGPKIRNEDRGPKITIVCHSWMIVEDRNEDSA
jgi:hypothetical protein